jgi:hypothetical protein
MSGELLILVFITFKRWKGVYFWMIIATTAGLIIYTSAMLLSNFENSYSPTVISAWLNIGFSLTIFFYPLVLWSRLHLVISHRLRLLKAILALILFTTLGCVITTLGVGYGFLYKHPETYRFQEIVNRVEIVALITLEVIISTVYIYHTARFLKSGYPLHTRKVIGLLVFVQLVTTTLNAIEMYATYTDRVRVAALVNPLEISFKLRLEFICLNQLRSLVKQGLDTGLDLLSVPAVGGSDPEKAQYSNMSVGEQRALSIPEEIALPSSGSGPSNNSEITTLRGGIRIDGGSLETQTRKVQELDPIGHAEGITTQKAGNEANDFEAQYLGRWKG